MDSDCKAKFGETSTCLSREYRSNICSNPLTDGGCLHNKLGDSWNRKRVCNSQDPPGALKQGLCRAPPYDYTEIRIQSQNWDSAIVTTWLMQILLSEMLGVPASVETSSYTARTNLYDQEMLVSKYGSSSDLEAMRRGQQVKDCVPLTSSLEGYLPCAHVISEAWGSLQWTPDLVNEGVIEPPQAMGVLGHEGWYIPLHTAKTEPSLFHYSGFMGEENRQKLSKLFKRPKTWLQYCDEMSPTQCSTPDDTAARYPDAVDYEKYFVPGLFQGYFKATENNNCTSTPNCTGHFVDFPCGWTSNFEPMAYHLNIALESEGPDGPHNGYPFIKMQEIWRAANATKNHVVMLFFKPESLFQEFSNTDYAFQRVTFPEPTEECMKSRRPGYLQCSSQLASFEERMGDKAGTCDDPDEALQRIVVRAFEEITIGDDIPDAVKSPAYRAVKEFKIDNIQIGAIFSRWIENYDRDTRIGLREATCDWAVDNLDYLQSLVPDSFPRVVEERDHQSALSLAASAVAGVAVASSLGVSAATYTFRQKNSIKLAQIEFLWVLLAGLLLVSIGSLLGSLSPTDATCVATTWLVNLGYSLELVPLLVKSIALNRVMSAGRRMRRSNMKLTALFGVVAPITIIVMGLLAVWTALDPAQRQSSYILTDTVIATGDTVVAQEYVCKSKSDGWWIASFSWQLFLLFASAVLAFQNRNFREDLADTRTLGVMIYSHFIFLVLRGVTHILGMSSVQTGPALYQSLIISADVVATIVIYFLPKFMTKNDLLRRRSFISGSVNLASSPVGHLIIDRSWRPRASGSSNDVSLQTPSNQLTTSHRYSADTRLGGNQRQSSSGTSRKSPESAVSISPHSVDVDPDEEMQTDCSAELSSNELGDPSSNENMPADILAALRDLYLQASTKGDAQDSDS